MAKAGYVSYAPPDPYRFQISDRDPDPSRELIWVCVPCLAERTIERQQVVWAVRQDNELKLPVCWDCVKEAGGEAPGPEDPG